MTRRNRTGRQNGEGFPHLPLVPDPIFDFGRGPFVQFPQLAQFPQTDSGPKADGFLAPIAAAKSPKVQKSTLPRPVTGSAESPTSGIGSHYFPIILVERPKIWEGLFQTAHADERASPFRRERGESGFSAWSGR